jgi:hypothetical protein
LEEQLIKGDNMSKQSEAKINQRFIKKPFWPVCSNCPNFKFDTVNENGWYNKTYIRETNLRCGKGNFAVGKTCTCNEHPGLRQEIKE